MIKKNDFKYRKRAFSNVVTYKLLMTIHMIFAAFNLILTSLYFIGNYQNFLDKTQQIVLNILSITSIFTALISVFLIFETFIKVVTEKRKIRNIFNLLYLLITFVLCIMSIVISISINYISLG